MAPTKKTPPTRPSDERLSPAEFRALVLLRGWTYRALADRWGCSENWISKIARDPYRAMHYDDALRGLPQRSV